MTLSQQYRSQVLKQQQARLKVCVVLALVGHGVAIAWGTNWQVFLHSEPDRATIPVEFVEVDGLNSALPSTDSLHDDQRYAQTDATAGGIHQPDLPVSGENAGAENAGAENAEDPESASLAAIDSITPSPQQVEPAESWRMVMTQVWHGVTELPQKLERQWEGIVNPNRTAEGAIGVDAARDEIWGEYDAQLKRKINQHWQRIDVDVDRQVTVRFEIDRQGRLQQLQIIKSSGSVEADEAALSAVRSASPFQPLPVEASQHTLRVNFTFDYIAK